MPCGIYLVAGDGSEFLIDPSLFDQAEDFKNSPVPAEAYEKITIPEATGRHLSVVVDWLKHHKTDTVEQKRLELDHEKICISQWDRDFLGALDKETAEKVKECAQALKIYRLFTYMSLIIATKPFGFMFTHVERPPGYKK